MLKEQSIIEWERLERLKFKLFSKIDVCMKQMDSTTPQDRHRGLKTLRRILSFLTEDELRIFSIHHYSSRNCDIQHQLFEMLKKIKGPNKHINLTEMLLIMDLIQGLALLDYNSKIICTKNHRLSYLLTNLASKDETLLCGTLEALEAIMIDSCENSRMFESLGAIELICNLLKQPMVSQNLS
jgi:hypothetical protein